MNPFGKLPGTVEVRLKASSTCAYDVVTEAVTELINNSDGIHYQEGPMTALLEAAREHPTLRDIVDAINLTDIGSQNVRTRALPFYCSFEVQVYQLDEEGAMEDDEGEDGVPSFQEWALPSIEFEGLWESLYYDHSIKSTLLKYAASALLFSEYGVKSQLIAWNRVVLLHGPPGTGKTSLCKALAHKLAIRFRRRYSQASLVEVNAHSLFSKWFSESGKLVSKLFSKITELVEDESTLVFVLIDEVESLTSARKAAVSGSEPSDAIRAVNALLTQLDQLRRFPNAMVLTTSNITQAIDLAFVDRADIKAYIGPPSLHARYEVLRTAIAELQRVGIISGDTAEPIMLPSFPEACTILPPSPSPSPSVPSPTTALSNMSIDSDPQQPASTTQPPTNPTNNMACSTATNSVSNPSHMCNASHVTALSPLQHACQLLLHAANACEGFSGRTLRKLPFLAHATATALPTPCTLTQFLCAMADAAKREGEARSSLLSG